MKTYSLPSSGMRWKCQDSLENKWNRFELHTEFRRLEKAGKESCAFIKPDSRSDSSPQGCGACRVRMVRGDAVAGAEVSVLLQVPGCSEGK